MSILVKNLWILKYAPTTIEDCIVPEAVKTRFRTFVETGTVPHLLLSGPAGTGKTTIAKVFTTVIDSELLIINSSISGNIDTLRTQIKDFASTMSFNGKRKYVLLDEADGLTDATQNALRGFMMEYIQNCGFILTANHPDWLTPEIRSRCSEIDFGDISSSWNQLAPVFMRRIVEILKAEDIPFDLAPLVSFVRSRWADYRRIILDLQSYADRVGRIDTGILARQTDVADLITAILSRSFPSVEQWLINFKGDYATIYRALYDDKAKLCPPSGYARLIPLLATYQFQHEFAADKYLNCIALISAIMNEVPLHG